MEDLGRILIDIKDSAGGGGGGAGGGTPSGGGGAGSGSAGGGPRIPPRLLPPPPPPAAEPPTPLWERLTSAAQSASAMRGEFSGLVRSPSLGNFASAFSSSGAIGSALPALGAAALGAGVAIAGLAVTASAVKAALAFMERAADAVARRIQDVTRYSGALMVAVAQERFAELQRSMREAAVNGQLYAAVQREATRAGNATAAMMIQWNRILSYAAIVWHRMTASLANLTEKLLRVANVTISIFGRYFGGQEGARRREGLSQVMLGFSWVMSGAIGKIFTALVAVLKYLKLIDENTKPKRDANANDWFRADIAAIISTKNVPRSYERAGVPIHSGTMAQSIAANGYMPRGGL